MTLYDDLVAQGLPVISVDEKNNITMGPMTKDQERIYGATIRHFFYPQDYPAGQPTDYVETIKTQVAYSKGHLKEKHNKVYDYLSINNPSVEQLRDQVRVLTITITDLMVVLQDVIATQTKENSNG